MNTPAENPRIWSQEAKAFWGKDFIEAFDAGTAIFAPYTCEDISRDPALAIELERKSKNFQKMVIELGYKAAYKYIFLSNGTKVRAKREPLAAFYKMQELIASAYPEFKKGTCAENIFINPVMGEINSMLMAMLLKHRQENNKPDKFEYFLFRKFGMNFDKEKFLMIQNTTPEMLNGGVIGIYFDLLYLDKFIKEIDVKSQVDEQNLSVQERKAINDRLATIIRENRQFGVPLSIGEKEGVAKEKLYLQFDEIDPHSPEYSIFNANVVLYDRNSGERICESPNLMNLTKNVLDETYFRSHIPRIFNSMNFYIERDSGEIASNLILPRALKIFLGNEKYELLRSHLLMRLAELTCSAEALLRELGTIVESPKDLPKRNPSGNSFSKPPKVLPVRYFPRSIINKTVEEEADSERTVRLHNVTYHIRILPYGHHPSRKAIELAQAHDFRLGTVLINGQERYKTFVREHVRGQIDPDLTPQNEGLAIQAKTRGNVEAVMNNLK